MSNEDKKLLQKGAEFGGEKIKLEETIWFALDTHKILKIVRDETIETKTQGAANPGASGPPTAGGMPGKALPPAEHLAVILAEDLRRLSRAPGGYPGGRPGGLPGSGQGGGGDGRGEWSIPFNQANPFAAGLQAFGGSRRRWYRRRPPAWLVAVPRVQVRRCRTAGRANTLRLRIEQVYTLEE